MSSLSNITEGRGNTLETWKEVFEQIKKHTSSGPFQMSLVDVGRDHVVVEMPITDIARQPYGLLHGGASCLLAETVASMHSSWGLDLSRQVPVGIEINASHLSSASEGTVRATGRVLRRGASVVVHSVEITHVETGALLSIARVTNLLKTIRAPEESPARHSWSK